MLHVRLHLRQHLAQRPRPAVCISVSHSLLAPFSASTMRRQQSGAIDATCHCFLSNDDTCRPSTMTMTHTHITSILMNPPQVGMRGNSQLCWTTGIAHLDLARAA